MRSPTSRWLPCLASAALVVSSHARVAAAETRPPSPAAEAPASAHALTPTAIDPANLLLFGVDLDEVTITDGLGAYGQAEDPLLPVGELTRLLQMDVDVFPTDRRIVGRLGQARRSLLVDLRTAVARVGAQEISLKDEDVAITPTEIYLRASAMQRLLPLKIEVHPDTLEIKLGATELLPIQARLQRLSERPASGGAPEEPPLRALTPYRLFSPPSADVILGLGARSPGPAFPRRYDIRLAGDLLYADLQAYLASDERGQPASGRFLLQRRSTEGRLLGPLHATEINLGDTYAPGLAVGPRSADGRGIMLSTAPLEQSSVFNRIDLRGELPTGYDVELYINDVLRGGQNTPNNGRYEFLNIPLSPGVNVIRTVVYGPRGDRTEETRIINVGGGLLHRGQADLELGIVDQDVPLINFSSGQETSLDPGVQAGGLRAVGSLSYGLTNALTVQAGAALTPHMTSAGSQDPRATHPTAVYTVGARTPLGPFSTQLDLAGDNHGGRAAVMSLAAGGRGISGSVRHAEYQGGFIDENNIGADAALTLQRRTELQTDANIPIRGAILPVSLRVVRNGYVGGGADWEAAVRASSSLGSVLYSAGLQYDRQAYRPAAPVDKLTGYLSASTFRSFNWQIRASLDFDLAPDLQARTLSVTANRPLSDNWSLQVAVGEPLDAPTGTNLAVSSIYHSRYGDLALTASYDNAAKSWVAGAQLNFGLGYNPDRSGYQLTATGPGSGGSAVVDAYYDDNGNGVRDPGERPAPGVQVEGAAKKVATDKDGRAYVTGLGSTPTARLSVNLDALQDSAFTSPASTLETSPRPGSVARFNYPIRPTGGVNVIIELARDDGKRVGLSSVKVALVPEHGASLEQTTEFDGSAVFDQAPLGAYRVELDPTQAKQLRMHLVTLPSVLIKGGDGFTPDVRAEVRFDPADQASGQGG
ncbi:MAG: hypothetical protein JWQ97_2993 [Phenylobacterium sp.]|nr:hypothetical protein [Phenylobacterium sp.]